jgi:membrane-bound lytic murein transglycosylase D
MTAPHLKRLLVSLILLPTISFADTNVAGDEIVILWDAPAPLKQDTHLNFGISSLDPVPSYLPDDSEIAALEYPAELAPQDDLWLRIKEGYGMPELSSEYTRNHESWYAARPDYVKRMVARSQRYLYHIVEEVEKRGMPTEIALLPMVESAFNPQAYSRSKASGIWQFIPSTGKDFGLKQNWWVDNRRDVTAATNAALTYLQRLHVMFGTWDLALAAYNAGEGTVRRAIERNRKQGLPTDYESLTLPAETRNYVPKLQAVKNIMTHPEQYGLEILPIPNRPYFTKVSAPEQIDAHLAAKLAEISYEEFSSLNPEYNRPVLTATGTVHELLLPVGTAEVFKTNLENYDKPLVSWQTYHAKRGERMDSIARKFGISLSQLRNVNDLPSRNKLAISRQILVPNAKASVSDGAVMLVADSSEAVGQTEARVTQKALQHRVAKGDTLQLIAKRYGTDTRQLMQLNRLKSSKLKVGMQLTIRPAAKATVKAQRADDQNEATDRYVVRKGDTLSSIARKFDVGLDDLQRWNNIEGHQINPGNRLYVVNPDEA